MSCLMVINCVILIIVPIVVTCNVVIIVSIRQFLSNVMFIGYQLGSFFSMSWPCRGGGGARTFSMAHMMKSNLGGGWCKTQISKSTQGSFFVFRWGCGVSNRDFEKYQGTFFYEK